jgi:hypothetical protein
MQEEKILEKQIEAVKKKLMALGPFRSGAISEQYNVCGKDGCKCKDKKSPQKHGPYFQLSYYSKKKHTTAFIRGGSLDRIRNEIDNQKIAKELFNEWLDLNAALSNLRLREEKLKA